MIEEFRKFALRGNLVDLAVGFTVGAAFTTIAQSLVNDIIMPVVGLVVGRSDFSDLFILLRAGAEQAPPYQTVGEAEAAGAVTVNYGVFINNVIAFLIVALAMFFLIRAMNRIDEAIEAEAGVQEEKDKPTTKKCPYCVSTIPRQATRCPQCTSELEPAPTDALQQRST
jgi:large conductance mechanosensitive channel